VLQATKDLRKVSLWLGHAHMQRCHRNPRARRAASDRAAEVTGEDAANGGAGG
jgi:hypothetical protein